jgi:hypothetical protein
VGDEREMTAGRPKSASEQPDVEAHKHPAQSDQPDHDNDDDKPDVEAHYHKS